MLVDSGGMGSGRGNVMAVVDSDVVQDPTKVCCPGARVCVLLLKATGDPATPPVTFWDFVEAVQAERQVRVARVILEDPAVGPRPVVGPQAGVEAHQGPGLLGPPGILPQTGAAGAEATQDELADAQVEAQHHDVDAVHQQQTGRVVPASHTHRVNAGGREAMWKATHNGTSFSIIETWMGWRNMCCSVNE